MTTTFPVGQVSVKASSLQYSLLWTGSGVGTVTIDNFKSRRQLLYKRGGCSIVDPKLVSVQINLKQYSQNVQNEGFSTTYIGTHYQDICMSRSMDKYHLYFQS